MLTMMTLKKQLTRSVLAVCATASAALAGPIENNRLPADTAWVIHIDFEQVRSTAAGRFLMHEEVGLNLDEMREEIAQELGFDLFAEAMDMTMQGPGNDETDAVIVLTTTPAVDQALEYIERDEPTHEMMLIDEYELHTWHDEKSQGPLYLYMKKTDRGTRRQVVLSSSVSRLLLTLKTMQGDAPDITNVRESPLAINARPGALLYIQTASMEFMKDLDLDDRITKGTGRVTFQISEHDDLSRIDLACTADSEQRARTMSEIVQGLVGLGKLITSEDHDLQMLHHVLQAVRSEAHKKDVTLQFAIPSEELEKMMHHEHGHGHQHD